MDTNVTISVIMPLYNGAQNIIEQLDSIRLQERQPDEVLLKDDGSTDNTVEIVQKFIKDHKLENWTLTVNKENVGWRNNFINMIHEATGDIIFFSDQDDIWYTTKISHMTERFLQDPENIKVLVSNYDELIEPNGVSYPCEKRKNDTKGPLDELYFSKKNVFLNRPGWVYAFQKDFIPTFDKFLETSLFPVHDMVMWSAAVMCDKLYLLNEATGRWRKHGTSAMQIENEETDKITETKRNIRLVKLERLKKLTLSNIYFAEKNEINDRERKLNVLRKILQELDARLKIVEEDKPLQVILNTSKYTVVHSYFADIWYFLKRKTMTKYR